MPRDVVPCLYREQVLHAPLRAKAIVSCAVTERFERGRVARQTPDTNLSVNAHQVPWWQPRAPTVGLEVNTLQLFDLQAFSARASSAPAPSRQGG